MLSFLQGFAMGLVMMSGPWLLAGMVKPEWVLAEAQPRRLTVWLRYGVILPFVCLLLGLTSLWGGFGPSLAGWLSGLGVLFAWVPLERRIRRFFMRRQQQKTTQAEQEQPLADLARDAASTDALPLVKQLEHLRQVLLQAGASSALPERFYSRYVQLQTVLRQRFQPQELAMQRAQTLVGDVYAGCLRRLQRLVDLYQHLQALDPEYIQRQLASPGIPAGTRDALIQRWQLVENLQQEIAMLMADAEKLLTALDSTRLALVQLQRETQSDQDLNQVLETLERFNQRVAHYESSASTWTRS